MFVPTEELSYLSVQSLPATKVDKQVAIKLILADDKCSAQFSPYDRDGVVNETLTNLAFQIAGLLKFNAVYYKMARCINRYDKARARLSKVC